MTAPNVTVTRGITLTIQKEHRTKTAVWACTDGAEAVVGKPAGASAGFRPRHQTAVAAAFSSFHLLAGVEKARVTEESP